MAFAHVRQAFAVTGIDPGEKLVLLTLANRSGPDGSCFPSQLWISEHSGIKVRSVRSHLGALERRGLISRQRRNDSSGSRTSDLYTITISLPAKSAARNGVNLPAKSAAPPRQILPSIPSSPYGVGRTEETEAEGSSRAEAYLEAAE